MTDRFFFGCAALVGLLVLAGSGCGSSKSCEELCELNKSCSDFPDETPCKDQCESREVVLKESGCRSQQEAYDACLSELEDVCAASSKCGDEALAVKDCVEDYCAANAGAPSCP
jgi:hypothetical protein